MAFYNEKLSLSGDVSPGILIFAEGSTELRIARKLLSDYTTATPDQVKIILICGINRFRQKINLIAKEPNFEFVHTIAVLIDADDDPDNNQEMAEGCFAAAGFPAGSHRRREDGFLTEHGKTTGVFISPEGGTRGDIESLAWQEVRASCLARCVTAYEQCVNATLGRSVDHKAMVQAYISAQSFDDPKLCGMGLAVEKGVIDIGHEAYRPLREFFATLTASC